MESGIELVVVLAVGVCSAAVVAFESPVRSAVALIGALLSAAAAVSLMGQPVVGALLLWTVGGGAGLLLLLTILLLDLRPEETGSRRFSLRRTAALMMVAWLGFGLFAVTETTATHAVLIQDQTALAVAIFQQHALSVLVFSLCLLAAMLAGLTIARRRG